MRSVIVLLPFALACAGGGSGPPAAVPAPQIIETAGGAPLRVEGQVVIAGGTVAAPIDSAWTAAIKVYNELGIQVTTLITESRTIGNQALKIRRALSGVPLSRYLNCGAGSGVGPNADYYNIEMSIMTYLVPNTSAATDVQTRIDAKATPLSVASNPVVCVTTGVLERRIAKMIQERV